MCRPRLHSFPRAILVHEQSGNAVLAQKIGSRFRTKNKCDFCRHLCLFATVCHDGDRPQIALRWQTRAWVEYMVAQYVALPPVAMSDARSGNGTVMQWDRPELLLTWDCNQPLLSRGWESPDGEVSSCIYQGRAYAALV